jgi:hypothetical protein
MKETVAGVLFAAFLLVGGVVFIWLSLRVLFFFAKTAWSLPGIIRDHRRYRDFERRVTAQMDALMQATPEQAAAMLTPFLGQAALLRERKEPATEAEEERIRQLDPALGALLRGHREIVFEVVGFHTLSIAAEHLLSPEGPDGLLVIGANHGRTNLLCVRPGSPMVHEVDCGVVVAKYASLFHYILLNMTECIQCTMLVRSVLDGTLRPDEALARWPVDLSNRSPELTEAWTNLRHYADDADLHKADPEYLKAERLKLEASLRRLKLIGG